MLSLRLLPGLLAAALGLGFATVAQADTVYLSAEDFLHHAFATPPRAEVFWLDNTAQEKLTRIFGHPYRAARVRYWREGATTVWILEDIGKEFPITAGFLVKAGQVDEARVLVYRESRGMEIHLPAFLRQFNGARIADDKLSTPIDGISGATLSVAAMERMARAALILNQLATNPVPAK